MGAIAGAIAGAAADVTVAGMNTATAIATNNKTNKTNLQIAQETNKQNAANVAATNEANVAMNESTNQANLAINQATNAANVAMNQATNEANYNIAQETNRANAEIAQMNNEYNQQMLERQIEQEWVMWNAENEYNTPAAQMQRQREAGINPYVAANAGSISSGNASSMTSPAAQPASSYTAQGATMQAPVLQPTSLTPGHVDAFEAQMVGVRPPDLSALDGLRGIVGSFFDIKQKQADVENQSLRNDQIKIENQYLASQIMARLANLAADTDSKKAKTAIDKISQKYQDDIYSSELKKKREETLLTSLQAAGQSIANLSANEWYKTLPQRIQMDINERVARISNLRVQGRLTAAQVKTEVERQVDVMYSQLLKGQQYQMNMETWNVQKKKVTADLVNAILQPGSGGPLNLISKGAYSFGVGSLDRDIYDPANW